MSPGRPNAKNQSERSPEVTISDALLPSKLTEQIGSKKQTLTTNPCLRTLYPESEAVYMRFKPQTQNTIGDAALSTQFEITCQPLLDAE
jgi:hypothetical protein